MFGSDCVALPFHKNCTPTEGRNAILTKKNHFSGSDRIYEVYKDKFNDSVDLIINLQGDMPNIKPDARATGDPNPSNKTQNTTNRKKVNNRV